MSPRINQDVPRGEPISDDDLWLCRQNLPGQIDSPILVTQGHLAEFALRLIARIDLQQREIVELMDTVGVMREDILAATHRVQLGLRKADRAIDPVKLAKYVRSL